MKIGDYVRTKNGIIGKIIDKNMAEVDNRYELDYNNKLYYYDQIAKSSSSIIDLIEVGDYVNGRKIDFISKDELYSDYNNSDYWYFEKEDIKSIVTKELIEEIGYKVGDNNA